jgi:hypothetical protein
MQVATAADRPIVGGWGPGTPEGTTSLLRRDAYAWSAERLINYTRATNVRYVVVSQDSYWPPAFKPHGTAADLNRNLSSSSDAERVYRRDGVTIYRISDVPAVVSGPVRTVDDGEAYLRNVSRSPATIYVPPDERLPEPGRGYRDAVEVSNVTRDGDTLRYQVRADRPTLAVFPVKDSPALSVTVDGDPASRRNWARR